MSKKLHPSDSELNSNFVINPVQLGGIDPVSQLDGPGAGMRSAWVNTGGGLHYKVLIDRGLDIAEAFYKGLSLTWLSLSGHPQPEMSLNSGANWLWGFGGGLLASCGPSSAGKPTEDAGEELSLHGRHSNIRATVESLLNPDPACDRQEMSITGLVRQAKLFNPNIELRRTITSKQGENTIKIEDDFINRGNEKAEHAWLLHINFGYPLLEPGSELVFAGRVSPLGGADEYFNDPGFRKAPEPLDQHRSNGESVAYIDPQTDKNGIVQCGIINEKRNIGVRLVFSKNDFPRICSGRSGLSADGVLVLCVYGNHAQPVVFFRRVLL